ncbi:unnamed protein product [Owenia fusiformis]|uniref:Uncharacterized protein n=1 Tax=Owenia fusiformis TaxID=6347 RepID=A0A8J1TV59_OWEFU|nr:unnamed protein product [Owenia fusiformis]
MASQSTIQDERIEDILECKLCLEPLNQPKSLPCQHSFCLRCIQDLIQTNAPEQSLPCPICRDIWQIPNEGADALKPSFLINTLMDIVKKTTQSQSSDAKSFSCKYHPDRPLELYCQDDNTLICYKCYADHHDGHTFVDINKAAEIQLSDTNKTVEQQLTSLSDIIDTKEEENAEIMTKNVRLIEQVNLNRKQAHDAINKEFDSKINEIYNRQGTQIKSRISCVEKLQIAKASTESLLTHLDTLKNTGHPTEVMELCLDIKENGLPKPEWDQSPPFVHLQYKKCAIHQDKILFGSLSEVIEKKGTKSNVHDRNQNKVGTTPPGTQENVVPQQMSVAEMDTQNISTTSWESPQMCVTELEAPRICNISESDENVELQELSGNVWNSFTRPSSLSSTDTNERGFLMDSKCSSMHSLGLSQDPPGHWAPQMPGLYIPGSNMVGSNMVESNMVQPNMMQSNTGGPNMYQPNMTRSNMVYPNMAWSNMVHPNMAGSNMVHPNMAGSNMVPPNMVRSDVQQSNMVGPNVLQSNMSQSNTSMAGSNVLHPNMALSNMPLQMCGSNMPRSNMVPPNMPWSNMSGSNLYMPRLHLQNIQLPGPSINQDNMNQEQNNNIQ